MRKIFETPGPKAAEALPLDVRARQIFAYFKKYNYTGGAAVHAAACSAVIRHLKTEQAHCSADHLLAADSLVASIVAICIDVHSPWKQMASPLARGLHPEMLRCTGAVKDTGEVIRFTGQYKASRGQAAALVFYVFMGEPSQLCNHAVRLHLAAHNPQYEADAARQPCCPCFSYPVMGEHLQLCTCTHRPKGATAGHWPCMLARQCGHSPQLWYARCAHA